MLGVLGDIVFKIGKGEEGREGLGSYISGDGVVVLCLTLDCTFYSR